MPRAKTSKKPTPSKSDFIRSPPTTLSAAEVGAKAKAVGLNLAPVLVYKVRIRARAKGKAKKSVVAKAAIPANTTSASTKLLTNTAAFVRAHRSLSPHEIVEKAKAAGIKLGVSFVYNIRGAAKIAAKKKWAAARSQAVGAVANSGGSSVSASAQNRLKAVAAEIGLGPAIEVLQGERARVRTLIGA
jgi:hypothetical protein